MTLHGDDPEDRDPGDGGDGDPGERTDPDADEGTDPGTDGGDDGDEWDPRDWDDHASVGGSDRDPDEDGPPGFVEALVDLLREVADAEDGRARTRKGFDRFGGASVDFSITAGSLTDHFGPPPLEEEDGDDEEAGPYVTTRETQEGCLVVADLQGVTGEDLSTRVDDGAGELVVSVDGDDVGRVPLDDPDLEVADARLNNEILEVRLANEH